MTKQATHILLDIDLKELAKNQKINLSEMFNEVLKNVVLEYADPSTSNIIELESKIKEVEDSIKSNSVKLHKLKAELISAKEKRRLDNQEKLKKYTNFAEGIKNSDIMEDFGN